MKKKNVQSILQGGKLSLLVDKVSNIMGLGIFSIFSIQRIAFPHQI